MGFLKMWFRLFCLLAVGVFVLCVAVLVPTVFLFERVSPYAGILWLTLLTSCFFAVMERHD